MEILHYDIWIADNATLRIVPICRKTDDSGNEQEIGETVNLIGQQWNSIDLALDEGQFANVTNWTNVYQVKIDNAANLTIWVGNAYFYRTTELPDDEAPTSVTASKVSESYFSAVLAVSAEDNSGAVSYVVKNGETEVASGSGASGATINITVNGLIPNTEYSFNVIAKDDAGNEADPVAVAVKTLVAPAPADAPTYDADKVIAIFTDIYTDMPFNIQGWWAEPAVAEGALTASSNALCIEPNNTENSCFGIAFAATDITGYDVLEMDVYATVADASFSLQVIGVGDATGCNLTASQWNHIVLDIKGNAKTNCEQIGFYNCNNLKGTCFVQNVLFAKKGSTTAIDNANVDVEVLKMIENGQLIIIKNGVRYNVAGQMVK